MGEKGGALLTNPDHALTESWPASTEFGGTPAGFTMPTGGYGSWASSAFAALPGADMAPGADPDGWANLVEYALASSPDGTSPHPAFDRYAGQFDPVETTTLGFVGVESYRAETFFQSALKGAFAVFVFKVLREYQWREVQVWKIRSDEYRRD